MVLEFLAIAALSISNELSTYYNTPNIVNINNVTYGFVYTPNGSEVAVEFNRDNQPTPFPFKWMFPSATVIETCSSVYNCHSYAWYSQYTEYNNCWMVNPSPYWSDMSYIEVFQPQIDDRICYFDYDESENPCIHSGIVVDISDYGLPIVESKWGASELFRHNYDDCPYFTESFNVRYFRRHTSHVPVDHYCVMCGAYTSTHNFHDPYVWRSNSMHRATCGCGTTTNLGHVVANASSSSGYSTCLLCGGRAQIGFIHSLSEDVDNFILPNGVVVLSDINYDLFMSGSEFEYINGDYKPIDF